jgi:hypothetical protein
MGSKLASHRSRYVIASSDDHSAPKPTGQLDPIDLHRRNITRMSNDAIIIPSYPGAGAALLGNILLELGLRYFDPYTELLEEDGSVAPVAERLHYRARLAASYQRDQDGDQAQLSDKLYCKTHRYPVEFESLTLDGVILLTRDPRDAMYSYYNWRLGFSEEGEHGTFAEFLQRGAVPNRPPVTDWIEFHQAWLESGTHYTIFAIVRFEDLKTVPHQTIRNLLEILGVARADHEIEHAIERSSFDRMRQHEDALVERDAVLNAQGRIMRRGKVNEWHEWYNRDLASYFEVPELTVLARRLGYEI